MGLPHVVYYLDDYLFCGRQGTSHCEQILKLFQRLARELGVPLAAEKTEGPAMVLIFLGIELHTVQQSSRFLEDKLVDQVTVTAMLAS